MSTWLLETFILFRINDVLCCQAIGQHCESGSIGSGPMTSESTHVEDNNVEARIKSLQSELLRLQRSKKVKRSTCLSILISL